MQKIHQVISGLPLPASKKDIVEYARNKGADTGVLDRLETLPDQEFNNTAEITDQLYENTK